MRKAFIEFHEANGPRKARELCPWAEYIIKADGGWWCFESIDDYNTYVRQR